MAAKSWTVYTHDDHVELYPEWIPFARYFMKPIVRILSGDETILTKVFQLDDHNIERQGFFSSIINWIIDAHNGMKKDGLNLRLFNILYFHNIFSSCSRFFN